MDIWSILGISPTDDISVIKKAYAKNLKKYHPEDDPKGFQQLKEAYDMALKHSKRINANKPKLEPVINDTDDSVKYIETPTPLANIKPESLNILHEDIHTPPHVRLSEEFINKSLTIEELHNKFIKEAEILYNNFFSRIQIDNWKTLLNNDVMWDISNRKQLNNKFYSFLSRNHYLPLEIWRLLEVHFKDSEHDSHLGSSNNLLQFISTQISQDKDLSYKGFKELEDVDYEKYLEYREKAFTAFTENKLKDAESYISQAKNIYPYDTELIRLEVQYYIAKNNIDEALSALNQLLQNKPDDKAGLLKRARIYYKTKQYNLAIEDYSKIQDLVEENRSELVHLSECFYETENYEQAIKYAFKVVELDPYDNEANIFLEKVYKKLKLKILHELKQNPKDRDIKIKLKNIKKEISVHKKSKKLIKTSNILHVKKSYIGVAIILFICIFGGGLYYLQGGNKKVSMAPASIPTPIPKISWTILNGNNVNTLTPGTKDLKVDLTNVLSLKLFSTSIPNDNGKKEKAFLPIPTGEKALYTDIENGWVYVGSLDDKKIIFTAMDATYLNYKSDGLYLSGTLKDNLSPEMLKLVQEELKKKNISTENLITTRYIVMEPRFNFTYDDKSRESRSKTPSFPHFVIPLIIFMIMGAMRYK